MYNTDFLSLDFFKVHFISGYCIGFGFWHVDAVGDGPQVVVGQAQAPGVGVDFVDELPLGAAECLGGGGGMVLFHVSDVLGFIGCFRQRYVFLLRALSDDC